MSWRLARSLEVLRGEVDAAWPARSKASDGTIGDAAHATRTSDHNPWVLDANGVGVVRAIDITHDPTGGPDAAALAEHFRRLGAAGDRRVSYVISRSRIASGTPKPGYPPWDWRPYSGSNPHDKHVHLSVSTSPAAYDSPASWQIGEPMPTADEIARATVRELRATEIPAEPGKAPTRWPWTSHVRYATTRLRDLDESVTQLLARSGALDRALDKLAATVAELAAGQQIDPAALVDDVRAAAEEGARAALESGVVDVAVTVRDETAELEEAPA